MKAVNVKSSIRFRHLSSSVYEDASSQEPTLTLPDEAMTIPYILSRYVKGHPLGVEKNSIDYQTDNFDTPDWEKMKYADIHDLEIMKEEYEIIQQSHEYQKKQKILKKKKAEAEKLNPPKEAETPPSPPSPPFPTQSVKN